MSQRARLNIENKRSKACIWQHSAENNFRPCPAGLDGIGRPARVNPAEAGGALNQPLFCE